MALTRLKDGGSAYRAEMDARERASRDEIMALQKQRLAWSLKHAYDNVAHYRKAFDQAGVHPSDFRELADLAKFPFTVKTDLRDNYPFNMFAVPREKLVRVHASSGTTGKPIVVGYTQADIDTWSDVMARSIRAAGGRSGMIIHNAYGYGLFTGGLGVHHGAIRLGATVLPISGGMTDRQVRLVADLKPDILTCTPSYAIHLGEALRAAGVEPTMTAGVFGAEPWTDSMRGQIERLLGLRALDIYGLSEIIGPGVACQSLDSDGLLNLAEDHFVVAAVDVNGASVADGMPGELVFTTLTKIGMPLLRYRSGDVASLAGPIAGWTVTSTGAPAMGRSWRSTTRPWAAQAPCHFDVIMLSTVSAVTYLS